MDAQMKEALDGLGSAFEEYKTVNDARLEEISKNGAASAEMTAKVDALNKVLDESNDKIASLHAEHVERMDEIEASIERTRLTSNSPSAKADVAMHARQFFSQINNAPIDESQAVDVEQYLRYKSAFNQYMRRGDKAVAPEVLMELSVGSQPDGGYWVTPDTSGRVAGLIYETSPIRQIANVQPIGTDALEGPKDTDEGTSGGWVSEKGTRGDTATAQIGMWRIPANEQFAQPKTTQKLLDDANVDVEGWLAGKTAAILARTENTAFVSGDGIEKPRGFLTYAAGTPTHATYDVIEQTSSGAAGDFAATDPGDPLIDMVFTLKNIYRGNARWVMARTTLAGVRKLKDGDGNYLWNPDFTSEGISGALLGHGVTEAEDMPVIAADSLSIAFGNWSEAYQIVDRAGISVLRDPFTDKPFVKFYTTKRVGGDMVNFEALKIMKFEA